MRKISSVELRNFSPNRERLHADARPSADRRDHRRDVLAAGAFLVVAALLLVRALTLLNVPGHPTHHGWALQDFRDAIYYPVVAFLAGHNPYDVQGYFAHYPVGQE